MIADIFDGVVNKIVKTVQRKKRFYFERLLGKMKDDLKKNWSRAAMNERSQGQVEGQVLDLKMEGKSLE